jgi:hypothetical protein
MRMLILLITLSLMELSTKGGDPTILNNTSIAYGPRVIVDTNIQDTVDSWFKGSQTNGLVCAMAFDPPSWSGSPEFNVNIINGTTNFIRGFVRLPFDDSANIDLFDSNTNPVPKTQFGEKVNACSDQKAKELFQEYLKASSPSSYIDGKPTRNTNGAVDVLFPLLAEQISNETSLPKLFKLKHPGEYELHLQMRAAFVHVDSSGKVKFDMFWFPEVVAKVQVVEKEVTH